MPSQSERREKSKEKLLAAARSIFASQGFEQSHTGDILNEAGMSRGGMYHHFSSKKDIFEAVFSQESERAIQRANADLKATDSALEDLISACLSWLQVVRDPDTAAILLDQGPQVLGWQRAREIEAEASLGLMIKGLKRAEDQREIKLPSLQLTARLLNALIAEAALAALHREPATSKAKQEATLRLFIESLKSTV